MPWGVAGDGAALVPLLLRVAFALAIVVAAVYLVGRLVDRAPGGGDARTVLETRYARGEIDDEEFERRRDRLAAET